MKFDKRAVRLIAVGASVAANCQPCLLINVTKAWENGAADPEIAEAIEIGKMVWASAASKIDKYAAKVGDLVPQAANPVGQECGCHPS